MAKKILLKFRLSARFNTHTNPIELNRKIAFDNLTRKTKYAHRQTHTHTLTHSRSLNSTVMMTNTAEMKVGSVNPTRFDPHPRFMYDTVHLYIIKHNIMYILYTWYILITNYIHRARMYVSYMHTYALCTRIIFILVYRQTHTLTWCTFILITFVEENGKKKNKRK